MAKRCAICGQPSGNYELCKKHYHHKDIVKCSKCGHWYNEFNGYGCPYCFMDKLQICPECGTIFHPKYGCPNCNELGYDTQACFWDELGYYEKPNAIQSQKCIICGKESHQYAFCPNCYYKYRNKIVSLKITNCSKIDIIDGGYDNPYMCEDGHPVKSQQEALIDNYLFNHNIRHIYEKAFPIDSDKSHDLHPDFYLPDLDVYIEHWGIKDNPKYEETKEYKIPFYQKAKITLICTDSNDIANISANLERKLKFFEKGKINWLK